MNEVPMSLNKLSKRIYISITMTQPGRISVLSTISLESNWDKSDFFPGVTMNNKSRLDYNWRFPEKNMKRNYIFALNKFEQE